MKLTKEAFKNLQIETKSGIVQVMIPEKNIPIGTEDHNETKRWNKIINVRIVETTSGHQNYVSSKQVLRWNETIWVTKETWNKKRRGNPTKTLRGTKFTFLSHHNLFWLVPRCLTLSHLMSRWGFPFLLFHVTCLFYECFVGTWSRCFDVVLTIVAFWFHIMILYKHSEVKWDKLSHDDTKTHNGTAWDRMIRFAENKNIETWKRRRKQKQQGIKWDGVGQSETTRDKAKQNWEENVYEM